MRHMACAHSERHNAASQAYGCFHNDHHCSQSERVWECAAGHQHGSDACPPLPAHRLPVDHRVSPRLLSDMFLCGLTASP